MQYIQNTKEKELLPIDAAAVNYTRVWVTEATNSSSVQ